MCYLAPRDSRHTADLHLTSLVRTVPFGCRLYAKSQWQEHPVRRQTAQKMREWEQVEWGLMILAAGTGNLYLSQMRQGSSCAVTYHILLGYETEAGRFPLLTPL